MGKVLHSVIKANISQLCYDNLQIIRGEFSPLQFGCMFVLLLFL